MSYRAVYNVLQAWTHTTVTWTMIYGALDHIVLGYRPCGPWTTDHEDQNCVQCG